MSDIEHISVTKTIDGQQVTEVYDIVTSGGDANMSKATYDVSPATKAHAVDDFIYFNSHVYKVTSAISIGDSIAVGTNITADLGLEGDTQIYIDGIPGGGGGGGSTGSPNFVGTTAEWNALSAAQKAEFDASKGVTVNLSDDSEGNSASRNDISTLQLTGNTNTSGNTIAAGVYFYLNGSLTKAKTNIVNGDTFVLNTNYELKTINDVLIELNDNSVAKWGYINITSATTMDTLVPGTHNIPRMYIVNNNAVDTSIPNGVSLLISYGWYENGTGEAGQMLLSYDTIGLRIRRATASSWTAWREIS